MHAKIKSHQIIVMSTRRQHTKLSLPRKKSAENLVQKSEFLLGKKKLTVFSCLFMSLCSVLKALLHHCHQLRNATVAVKSSSKH